MMRAMTRRSTLAVPTLTLALIASACAGGTTSRGGGEASAEAGRPHIDCSSDGACPLEAGLCIPFDRAGGRNGPGPTRRQCVASCESQGDCGADFRCSDQFETFQEGDDDDDEAGFALALSQGVCAPVPRYGRARLGADCEVDEDCAEAAPHCVDAGSRHFCTQLCDGDCPRGFRCRAAQVMRADRSATVHLCAPDR